MAVYERKYQRYGGVHTPLATRFLILPRYIFRDVFKSRWMVAFFAMCFIFPLFSAGVTYLANNASYLEAIPEFQMPDFLLMDGSFLLWFLRIQGISAFVMAVFIGPGLISRDLANNGLPLYLSRPFSRLEYVGGKLAVMAILLSSFTWFSAWLLILMHANFVGLGWILENMRLVLGVFVGSWIWILTLGLMALSISALVKWRPVAGFTMVGLLSGGSFFGSGMINALFRTEVGHLLSLSYVMDRIWEALIGIETASSISVFSSATSLGLFLVVFSLLLFRKIRAYEVVG